MGLGKTVELLGCILANPMSEVKEEAGCQQGPEAEAAAPPGPCVCGSDSVPSGKTLWLQCDACESWFHASCLGIRRPPPGAPTLLNIATLFTCAPACIPTSPLRVLLLHPCVSSCPIQSRRHGSAPVACASAAPPPTQRKPRRRSSSAQRPSCTSGRLRSDATLLKGPSRSAAWVLTGDCACMRRSCTGSCV